MMLHKQHTYQYRFSELQKGTDPDPVETTESETVAPSTSVQPHPYPTPHLAPPPSFPPPAHPVPVDMLIVTTAVAHKLLLVTGAVVGLICLASILPETVYSITRIDFSGKYWCKGVGE